MNVIDLVKKDIAELRRLGVAMPAGIDSWIERHAKEVVEFDRNGMKVADITDLIKALAADDDDNTLARNAPRVLGGFTKSVRCPNHRDGGATRCPRGGAALQRWQRERWGDNR